MNISKSLLLASVLTLAPLAFSSASFAATTKTVKMQSITYDPKVLELKVGDGVRWDNVAHTEHSATSDDAGTFDTGLVAPGAKSKSVTMSKAGTFEYHCSVHGKTMHGQIVVTP